MLSLRQITLPLYSAILFAASVACANATTIYTDKSTFTSQLSRSVVDDYTNPNYKVGGTNDQSYVMTDAEMSQVLGETRYTSYYKDLNAVDHLPSELLDSPWFFYSAVNDAYQMDFSSTSVSKGNGVYGVGFDYYNMFTGPGTQLANAFVTFGDGSQREFYLDWTYGPWSGPDFHHHTMFFGITSDLGIKSIYIGPANGWHGYGVYGHTNLIIGEKGSSSDVPEPGSLALVGIALAGVGVARRRKA